jgi:hypothetical protein
MKSFKALFAAIVILFFISGCIQKEARYDENDSVPKGDPSFPPLTSSWVIDSANVLSSKIEQEGDNTCEVMKIDGTAEMVVLTIRGVKHPTDYATHYGRWLGLGRKGMASEEGHRGIVWIIRPDVPPEQNRIYISVGRGLPRFTSSDYGRIMEYAADYCNFNNYDRCVEILIQETEKRLRELYPQQKEKE